MNAARYLINISAVVKLFSKLILMGEEEGLCTLKSSHIISKILHLLLEHISQPLHRQVRILYANYVSYCLLTKLAQPLPPHSQLIHLPLIKRKTLIKLVFPGARVPNWPQLLQETKHQ
jgi:hypothetical protein